MKFLQKLVSRFGLGKSIAVLGVAVIIAIGAIGGAFTSGSNAQALDQYMRDANALIDQGELDKADALIAKAKAADLGGFDELQAISQKISRISHSQQYFDEGTKSLESKNYAAAFLSFSSVMKEDKTNFANAQTKLAELKPLVVKSALSQAAIYATKKNYLQAITDLEALMRQLGQNTDLQSAIAKYTKLEASAKKAKRANALSYMHKSSDSFEGITWYQDRTTSRYRNANDFYIYFGVSGSSPNPLRLVVQYYDDSWLFINSARINVDGAIYDINADEWKRDNNSSIWEWCDFSLDDREMIEAIIKSKKAVIRFDGDKYYDTRTISSTQKRALAHVLAAYDNF